MTRRPLAAGLLLPLFLGACSGNQYLRGYKVRGLEEERKILAPIAPDLAETIYSSKTVLKTNPRDTDAMQQLARAYDDLAVAQKGKSPEFAEYGAVAARYELRVYKSRGGLMTPAVVAETGRNLTIGGSACKGEKYLAKALKLDPSLSETYREDLKASGNACRPVPNEAWKK